VSRTDIRARLHAGAVAAAHRLGRFPLVVRTAASLRNLAQAVVAGSLADGLDPDRNGERWLIGVVAPTAGVVVDVGANVGDWTAAVLAATAPQTRAIVFEPSPAARDRLLSRFGADPRVEIVGAAVADRSGSATLYEEPGAGQASSLLNREPPAGARPREVTVTTIDDHLARRQVAHVDVLKIDAEGYDLHVLRGAERTLAAQAVAVVQFEYNRPWLFARSTLGEALRLLEQHGYEVLVLKRDGLHPFDYERTREFFAYANFVALSAEGRARVPVHAG
jgi:FkbM family methyltransferase